MSTPALDGGEDALLFIRLQSSLRLIPQSIVQALKILESRLISWTTVWGDRVFRRSSR
jgi:hypothetical protein